MSQPTILAIAIPCPLPKLFDYVAENPIAPGTRVWVEFGKRKLVGIVVEKKAHGDVANHKLKPVLSVLDHTPLLDQALLQLCLWASRYYHYPLGEVLAHALPKRLRTNVTASVSSHTDYQLSELGKAIDIQTLKRAPRQAKLLQLLRTQAMCKSELFDQGISTTVLQQALKKQWLETKTQAILPSINPKPTPALTLNAEQATAVSQITKTIDQFAVHLLFGVTGSGKTEVYFHLIQQLLDQKKQVLVLIPEISLTPQTLKRFTTRFACKIVALHSGLTDTERSDAWLLASMHKADIVVGTRSALLTSLPALGMIIVDEEHDSSFKQQEGFRYHARDLAVIRAQQQGIPIVLGSATPSLESLYNVEQKKYYLITLTKRPEQRQLPSIACIEEDVSARDIGLTDTAIKAIKQHLTRNEQVLIFINRRGFSPVLMCQSCHWIADCDRCDSRLVLHANQTLHCHQCHKQIHQPNHCPQCHSHSLKPVGFGTQKIAQGLEQHFPDATLLRIDRDSIRNKNDLTKCLDRINNQQANLLIGTQMLAKGHHFPHVTLVVILQTDNGLLSSDFRATERTGQMLLQVAGRAGRADKPGHVLIQTTQPKHPLLQPLIQGQYLDFANLLLQERKECLLPPYQYHAYIRAESKQPEQAMRFLEKVAHTLPPSLTCFGPIPASMQKKAGFFRAILLLQQSQRQAIQSCLTQISQHISTLTESKYLRWSIDVDPIEAI